MPSLSVYRPFSVRSSRAERNTVALSAFTASRITSPAASPPNVSVRIFIYSSAFFHSIMIALANRKNPIRDRKYTASRRSITPLLMALK